MNMKKNKYNKNSKKKFRNVIEEKKELVKSLDISEVMSHDIQIRKKGRSYVALCPFHNDRRLGNFHVSDQRGTYKCFSCGASGDAIAFVQEYHKKTFVQALDFILERFNIEVEEYTEEELEQRRIARKKKQKKERIERRKREKRLERTRRYTYAILQKYLTLSDDAKTYLLGRGLTEEDIQRIGYRSPFLDKRENMDIFGNSNENVAFQEFLTGLDLLREGREGTKELLDGVAGFYQTDGEIHSTLVENEKTAGIIIPILDVHGYIRALQYRNKIDSEHIPRYVWVSSDGLPHGGSSGSPFDIHIPERLTNQRIYITEGHFKALKLSKETGSLVISVQGVAAWRNIRQELSSIYRYFNNEVQVHYPMEEFIIAYDADLVTKENVKDQMYKLAMHLEQDLHRTVDILRWDEKYGKGIDDVFFNGHEQKLYLQTFEEFKKKYYAEKRQQRTKKVAQ